MEECEKSTHPSTATFAKESEVMRGRGSDFAEKVDRGDQGSSSYDVHRVHARGYYCTGSCGNLHRNDQNFVDVI